MKRIFVLVLAIFSVSAFAQDIKIQKRIFGKAPNGQKVNLYTLTNAKGMKISLMDYGATLTSVVVPDNKGKFADIALGYNNFKDYVTNNQYFGGIVGRYGNRIAAGKFVLDGKQYSLNTNNNGQHLHGGNIGFHAVVWNSKTFKNADNAGVIFTYLSKDGEENYPGNLNITVTYTFNNSNEITIDYLATTDKPTPINFTQHGYWNLLGEGNGNILKHELMINADKCTPVDKYLIPTGEIAYVKGTPLDFKQPRMVGERINDDDIQIKFGNGYDHNWVLNKTDDSLTLACRVSEPISGRVFEIYTTEPAMQFYGGGFMNGTISSKSGKSTYAKNGALVLEPQHFPDSPNHPNFPNTILRPGEKFKSRTVYKFSVKK
jgi:aldose 1-epimerase